MALTNYRDLSSGGTDLSGGFQFEFSCEHCSKKWRTPFKPYRMGQLSSLLGRVALVFAGLRGASRIGGGMADFNTRGAKEDALADVMPQAEQMFKTCPSCNAGVCNDCFSDHAGICTNCAGAAQRQQGGQGGSESAGRAAGGHACPNCGTAGDGGRFCPECGFDLASTHKGCPSCGTMLPRQARFCTDCGHSF